MEKVSRKTPTDENTPSQDSSTSNKRQKSVVDSTTDVNMSESEVAEPTQGTSNITPLEGLNASIHSTHMNEDENFSANPQSNHVEKDKQPDRPELDENGKNYNPESTNRTINIATLFNNDSDLVKQNEHFLFALAENVKGNTMNEKFDNVFKDFGTTSQRIEKLVLDMNTFFIITFALETHVNLFAKVCYHYLVGENREEKIYW